MASLIEELIDTLTKEDEIYEHLVPIVEQKTTVIVANDVIELQRITELEQEYMQQITVLEQKRREVTNHIATVISKKAEELTILDIIHILDQQPKEQKLLSSVHDRLKNTLSRLTQVNEHNQALILQSLEMIEFNLNFIQSTKVAPGNNYSKGAEGVQTPAVQISTFDAKQ